MKGEIIPEASYPLSFRQEDSAALASLIKKHESVCLVAMKKVGISNFVRFFFYHPGIRKKYFGKQGEKHLFLYCDLNDLLKISRRSFWILMLKRFSEAIAASEISPKTKKKIDKLFLQVISATDPFFFFDNLRKSIEIIATETNLYLTVFLLRFDRLKPVFSRQFFANLQSLFDIAKFRFSYLTTSVRPLSELCPTAFDFANLSLFAHSYFLKPAKKSEIKAILLYLNLEGHFSKIKPKIKERILNFGGGHLMLTRLIGISFSENKKPGLVVNNLLSDERITLALEEIWENLNSEEQDFLTRIVKKEKIKKHGGVDHLFKTGILKERRGEPIFFTPVFRQYIGAKLKASKERSKKELTKKELTKKENLLFDFLLKNKEKVCSRDEIIETVWPEYKMSDDLAVSDWAIDRLAWRLREKIKKREESYRIVTIRGRGYKLV